MKLLKVKKPEKRYNAVKKADVGYEAVKSRRGVVNPQKYVCVCLSVFEFACMCIHMSVHFINVVYNTIPQRP